MLETAETLDYVTYCFPSSIFAPRAMFHPMVWSRNYGQQSGWLLSANNRPPVWLEILFIGWVKLSSHPRQSV